MKLGSNQKLIFLLPRTIDYKFSMYTPVLLYFGMFAFSENTSKGKVVQIGQPPV
jgi:hypothetical protein